MEKPCGFTMKRLVNFFSLSVIYYIWRFLSRICYTIYIEGEIHLVTIPHQRDARPDFSPIFIKS